MNLVPYGRQQITDDDIAAVVEAMRDPFITQGPRVEAFESALADAVGARYAVAVNSGTAALHTAYFAAGVGPENGVLTSPITFVATANAALYLGGQVRFADVDPSNVMLDPAAVAAHADAGTGVLVPVHFGGHVADMGALWPIARRNGWTIIEDAAHALGARYRTPDGEEHKVGACAHSSLCCFSFHPVKHITTGEGGAVTTNDEELYRAMLRFRSHGITRDPAELEGTADPWYYEQHALGFNYRLTDIQCALGSSQLARLEQFVERRRWAAEQYDALFDAVDGVETIEAPEWSTGSYHLYVVRVPAALRRSVFDALRRAAIGVNVHYIPVPSQPYYRRAGYGMDELPHASAYYGGAITLPMFPDLDAATIERVARAVIDSVERALPMPGVSS
jgi:perosamine synthetase